MKIKKSLCLCFLFMHKEKHQPIHCFQLFQSCVVKSVSATLLFCLQIFCLTLFLSFWCKDTNVAFLWSKQCWLYQVSMFENETFFSLITYWTAMLLLLDTIVYHYCEHFVIMLHRVKMMHIADKQAASWCVQMWWKQLTPKSIFCCCHDVTFGAVRAKLSKQISAVDQLDFTSQVKSL